MATKIVTKNSSTASAVPTASDLVQGELAVNVADKRLFTEDNGGAIVELGTNPSTIDINAGTIDGTTIGASSASTGAFTTLTGTQFSSDATDVELKYSGSQKLATTSTGIDVTGTATMDGLISHTGSSATDIASLSGSAAGRALKIQSYDTSIAGSGFDINASGSAGEITLQTYAKDRLRIGSGGDISFYEDTGTTAKLFWDASAESLGIGTSSPSGKTHSVAADAQVAVMAGGDVSDPLYPAFGFDGQIGSNGGRGAGMYLPSDSTLAWSTAGAERARIDSSGNLLVGTTDTSPVGNNVAGGIALLSNGSGQFSRDGGTSLLLNRKSSDGELLRFNKDGTTVGSLGTSTGYLYIGQSGTTDAFLKFTGVSVPSIRPATASGANSDDTTDLGAASTRFKDLYLSGGVYLGGTGAANKLEDYETGTFTPAITFGGAAVGLTYTATRGRYTKVGRLVTVQIGIDINNKGTSTGVMNVTGLPFASATFSGGYGGHTGAMRVEGGWTGLTGATIPYVEESGSTTIVIRQGTSTGTNPVTDANTTSGYFFITSTYQTA